MDNIFYTAMNNLNRSLQNSARSVAPVTQFFKDSRLETAYALLRLSGEHREGALGIADEHYENRNAANAWWQVRSQALISLRDSGDLSMNDFVKAHHTLDDIRDEMVEQPMPAVSTAFDNFDNCQFYQVAGGDYGWRVWMLRSLLVKVFFEKLPTLAFTGSVWWVNPEIKLHGSILKGIPDFDYMGLYNWVRNVGCDPIDLQVLFSSGFHPFSFKEVLSLKSSNPDLILIENVNNPDDITRLVNCYSGTKTVVGFGTRELLSSPGVSILG